jgi:hypothetical protein
VEIGSCLARYTTELQALSGAAAALVAELAVFGLVVAVWYARFKRELAKAARGSVKDQIEAAPLGFFYSLRDAATTCGAAVSRRTRPARRG